MDSDEEDFVFYGTPIAREDDVNTSRKKKSVAEASGQLRTLAPWKQEVRDEEGRRRFHGAFSGGFSAGYYNTVGSKEGWTPQTFVSSRKNRAEVKQQDILNFLDEDERAELEGQSLGTSSQFDTFGFTAADHARKHAEKEHQKRPSAIPGPVPDELVLPATDSIGVKLLLKMGWRRGRSIKDSHTDVAYDARREARKAFLAFSTNDAKTQLADSEPIHDKSENYTEQPASDDVQSSQNTPVYVLNPKQDLHGLGFDPFKHAPEFREKKRSRVSDNRGPGNKSALLMNNNLFGFKSGKAAPGFGIGALEDFDAEDEDVYAAGYDFEETYAEDIDEPTKLIMDSKQKSVQKEAGALSGFRLASNSDYQLERFDPPVVPEDFVPHHKFPGPPETSYKLGDPGPPEVPPPQDNNLKLLIDGVATLVARCGKLFEDLSREKNQSNPLFSFLVGGNGHEYYTRKLWEEQQKRGDQTKLQLDGKLSPRTQKMTAESRGKILGERPLERSSKDLSTSIPSTDAIHLQYNLSDTFTDPSSYSEMPVVAKPFIHDTAKQERFEQFLKDKYQGGLRSTDSGRASHMSEAARALERLDFEAAAEAIKKGKWSKEISTSLTGGMEFTSGGFVQAKDTQAQDAIPKEVHVKRTEYQWRPSPILCKRFDLIDPYMGKPAPAPRSKSKIETLIFTSDSVKATKEEETIIVKRDSYQMPQPDAQGISKDAADNESGGEVEVENVLKRIAVTTKESDCYYHYKDNRVLPSHVDAELANAEAWWYKPEYIINELNINSVITTPSHEEILSINSWTMPYTLKGYAYSGGGKKVTRVEVTVDGGETWHVCNLDHQEKPNKYGKYWCWCFWSLDVEVLNLLVAKEIAVRAWDETHNTQPEKLIWNVMGMMNNCWFRVKINVLPHRGEIGIVFEHPTKPGNQSGGWMAKERRLETESNATLKKSVSSPFMNTSSKVYSMSEVKRHNTPQSTWIVVHGHVYDCTKFVNDHPGGADSILINAGTDCTEEFEAIHSDKAKKMLEEYRIGEVVGTTGYASDSSSPNNTVHGPPRISTVDSMSSLTNVLAPIKEITLKSVALNPREKIPCKLVTKTSISHDVRVFRFALPSEDQGLGLPVGKHIFLCAKIEGKLCMRAYTPTSSIDEVGYFDLVVKVYFKNVHPRFPNGGLMSQYLDSLPIGSALDVKGPLGHIEYTGKGNFLVHGKPKFAKKLAMIAGGTGITPIYQVAQAILKDPEDDTEMHVVYANRTEEDILLREELDGWAKEHERFNVWYVVSNGKEGWEYSVGYITESILREHVPDGSDGSLALVCGPPPMIQFAVQPNLEKLNYDVKNSLLIF